MFFYGEKIFFEFEEKRYVVTPGQKKMLELWKGGYSESDYESYVRSYVKCLEEVNTFRPIISLSPQSQYDIGTYLASLSFSKKEISFEGVQKLEFIKDPEIVSNEFGICDDDYLADVDLSCSEQSEEFVSELHYSSEAFYLRGGMPKNKKSKKKEDLSYNKYNLEKKTLSNLDKSLDASNKVCLEEFERYVCGNDNNKISVFKQEKNVSREEKKEEKKPEFKKKNTYSVQKCEGLDKFDVPTKFEIKIPLPKVFFALSNHLETFFVSVAPGYTSGFWYINSEIQRGYNANRHVASDDFKQLSRSYDRYRVDFFSFSISGFSDKNGILLRTGVTSEIGDMMRFNGVSQEGFGDMSCCQQAEFNLKYSSLVDYKKIPLFNFYSGTMSQYQRERVKTGFAPNKKVYMFFFIFNPGDRPAKINMSVDKYNFVEWSNPIIFDMSNVGEISGGNMSPDVSSFVVKESDLKLSIKVEDLLDASKYKKEKNVYGVTPDLEVMYEGIPISEAFRGDEMSLLYDVIHQDVRCVRVDKIKAMIRDTNFCFLRRMVLYFPDVMSEYVEALSSYCDDDDVENCSLEFSVFEKPFDENVYEEFESGLTLYDV